jgi:hypothetical protein
MSFASMPAVQIAASSEPFVWSHDEAAAMVTAGHAGTQEAGMYMLAPSIESINGEGISIAHSGTATTALEEAFDPNLSRAWSFE